MATQTTNYGLTKPSYNETADIGVINSNMDIIDAKMKEIDNKAGSGGGSGNTDTYGHVKVGSVTIDASGDDTIELVAGSNVTLTPDTTSKSVTISATGGGGGGTSDYLQLSNKPKINGVELVDNITTENLGIVVPQYTSELENDSGFITNETDPTVPAWAKEPIKPTYTAEEVGALPSNTPIPDPTSVVVDRFVSAGTHIADISVNGEKTELYAPTGGGGTSVTVDSELSTTSENPVQNKVITQALNEKGTYSKPTGGIPKTDLASEVQTSLENADTVPALATEVNSLSSTIDNQGESGYLGNGNLCDYSKIEVGIGWSGSANAARGRILIPFKSGDTYSVSVNAEALPKFKYLSIREIDKSTNANSLKNTNITESNLSYTDTLTSGANYIAVTFDCGTDTFYASMLDGVKIMVEKGNEIHSYTPYSKSNVELTNEKANNDIISDAWNASTTYEVGQYCIYNNSLWKCLVQNIGQTPTEGTYWTKASITSELIALWNAINA